jgi:pimeloyl-ACP methyl ester carboxylesterase
LDGDNIDPHVQDDGASDRPLKAMATRTLQWNWRGHPISLGADAIGADPQVLLLPALSSISTRHEMRPLQERLAGRYATLRVDWPGFGDRPRPGVGWTPQAYSEFLEFLLASVIAHPCVVIAAGHGATYALMGSLQSAPQLISRLVMIAPTWRGPLPTMLGGHPGFLDRICDAVDLPGLGPVLYRLNVNRPVVRLMSAGHVYADARFLTPERLREKLDVVHAPGARSASVRFVTGGLDPVDSREAFLDLARRATVPILLIHGAATPPKSQAEIEAFAAQPGIRRVRLPQGKLAVHEEFPDAVVEAIAPFLAAAAQAGRESE